MIWRRGPDGKHSHQRRQLAISRSVACEYITGSDPASNREALIAADLRDQDHAGCRAGRRAD